MQGTEVFSQTFKATVTIGYDNENVMFLFSVFLSRYYHYYFYYKYYFIFFYVTQLQSMRSAESYIIFWQHVTKDNYKYDVEEPVLLIKRECTMPLLTLYQRSLCYVEEPEILQFLDSHSTSGTAAATPESASDIEFYNTVISNISDILEQEGYQIFRKLEQLILSSGHEDEGEGCNG